MRALVGQVRRRPGLPLAIGLVVALALTVLVRVYQLGPAFGVFVDEITYVNLGRSMATQGSTILYGQPFFLHPPLFFILESAILHLGDVADNVFGAVYEMRHLNVALAGLSAVVLAALVWRLTQSRLAVAIVVGFFAVDPFTIRITSRVLLETFAGVWVLAGYLVVLTTPSAQRGSSDPHVHDAPLGQRNSLWVLAGMLFGLGILTKEPVALFTLVPLLAGALLRWLPWRQPAVSIGTAVLTYLPYPLAAVVSGNWNQYVEAKTSGALRLVGTLQLTGFNRSGSVPFLERVLDRVDAFLGTYVVLALGLATALYLLTRGRTNDRIVALWATAAYVYGSYSIVRGTLEEQFFYYLLLPALLASAVVGHRFWRSVWRAVPRTVGVAGLCAYLAFAAIGWHEVRTQPDDGYVQLSAYMEREAAPGAGVAVGPASETAEFVLQPFAPSSASDLDEIRRRNLRYVVVSTKSLADGTATIDPNLLNYLSEHAEVPFRASGRSVGELILYRLPEEPGPNPPALQATGDQRMVSSDRKISRDGSLASSFARPRRG